MGFFFMQLFEANRRQNRVAQQERWEVVGSSDIFWQATIVRVPNPWLCSETTLSLVWFQPVNFDGSELQVTVPIAASVFLDVKIHVHSARLKWWLGSA
jgi:hypothetical protein